MASAATGANHCKISNLIKNIKKRDLQQTE